MTTELQKAQESLAIEDVYLIGAKAWTHSEFDPIITPPEQSKALRVQFMCAPDGPVVTIDGESSNGTESRLRYTIKTGVRLLKEGVDAKTKDISDDHVFAEITATFAVRYLIKANTTLSEAMLHAFADNVVHHVWPYWREFIQATTSRLRLPPVMIPMRVVRKKKEAGQEQTKRPARQVERVAK